MRTLSFSLVVVALSGTASLGPAATLTVPGDAATIQDGINVAGVGDTILVLAGIYSGPGFRDIDFSGKDIVVLSQSGAAATILDCQGSPGDAHRAFVFQSGETAAAIVDGFTIRNGFVEGLGAQGSGGAVLCVSSSPGLRNCRFETNQAENGGAVALEASSATVVDCEFVGNDASEDGGGIWAMNSALEISGSVFEDNLGGSSGGAVYLEDCSSDLIECRFTNNSAADGGALSCFTSAPTFTHCLFAVNQRVSFGAALACWANSTPILRQCTFYGNDANTSQFILAWTSQIVLENVIFAHPPDQQSAVACGHESTVGISCSAAVVWPDCIAEQLGVEGNFEGDALLRDPENGDFTLLPGSPCLPGNHPQGTNCGLIGACDTTRCDLYNPPTSVEEGEEIERTVLPVKLLGSHPNPFNPRTTITFILSEPRQVRLQVFDLAGRRVRTLVDEPLGIGEHAAAWDGRDRVGRAVRSGVYVYRLVAGDVARVGKLVLIK